jgi:hypothetical protein
VVLVWIEYANGEPELVLDNADRLGQVGVVGDENGDITTFEAGIANHVRRNIDVGAFLFRLVYPDSLRGRHAAQRHLH